MDENEKLMARMDRINTHYKEYAEEIESAKETDGMYYIFKQLQRASSRHHSNHTYRAGCKRVSEAGMAY